MRTTLKNQSTFLLSALLFVLVLPSQAQDSFTTKFHEVRQAFLNSFGSPYYYSHGDPFGGSEEPPDPVEELIKMLDLPEGTKVSLFPRLGKVFAKTTAEGHETLAAYLKQWDKPPMQVGIDFTMVTLDKKEVERSKVFRETASLDAKEVLRLWRDGKGKLLSFGKITTLSGVNAQVECVEEIIYPTEFDSEAVAGFAHIETVPMAIHTPGAFETRQTGHIFNVTPTLSPDRKTISLALIPEKAELAGWLQYDLTELDAPEKTPKPARAAQPVFRSINFTTSIMVVPGEQTVVGGSLDPETGEPVYGIVTARLLDILAEAGK